MHVGDSAEVVAREAQRQTRWIKEALWITKTPTRQDLIAEAERMVTSVDENVVVHRIKAAGRSDSLTSTQSDADRVCDYLDDGGFSRVTIRL